MDSGIIATIDRRPPARVHRTSGSRTASVAERGTRQFSGVDESRMIRCHTGINTPTTPEKHSSWLAPRKNAAGVAQIAVLPTAPRDWRQGQVNASVFLAQTSRTYRSHATQTHTHTQVNQRAASSTINGRWCAPIYVDRARDRWIPPHRDSFTVPPPRSHTPTGRHR